MSYQSPDQDKENWSYYYSPEREGVYAIVKDVVETDWEMYKYYYAGDTVIYDGETYKCTFEHVSNVGYEPNNPSAWAIWEKI